jgi:hypothetical protein
MLFAAGAALQRFASISEPRGPRLPEQGSVPTGTFYRDLLDGIGRSGPRG